MGDQHCMMINSTMTDRNYLSPYWTLHVSSYFSWTERKFSELFWVFFIFDCWKFLDSYYPMQTETFLKCHLSYWMLKWNKFIQFRKNEIYLTVSSKNKVLRKSLHLKIAALISSWHCSFLEGPVWIILDRGSLKKKYIYICLTRTYRIFFSAKERIPSTYTEKDLQ